MTGQPDLAALPPPPVPPDCDVSDMPFPHDLLVKLSAEAFGTTEAQAIAMAVSLGWTRVPGGWISGSAGNG